MSNAPIAFFAYRRPEHTLKALTALAECSLAPESTLYIFCDGPKTPADRENVEKVRTVAASRQWCGDVKIITSENNIGLANSILEAVSKLCDEFGRVIVLEDDLLVSSGFLSYMNRGLDLYSADPRVMQISGHVFPIESASEKNDAFFIPLSTCWGWGTWKRVWSQFVTYDNSGYEELRQNGQLRKKFDLDGSYPYSSMLFDQNIEKIDSWGIRFWWFFFKHEAICLYPGKSLIINAGFGPGATHTSNINLSCNDSQWSPKREVESFPDSIVIDYQRYELVKRYIAHNLGTPPLLVRMLRKFGFSMPQ